jgi:hypothetical protein
VRAGQDKDVRLDRARCRREGVEAERGMGAGYHIRQWLAPQLSLVAGPDRYLDPVQSL